MFGSTDGQRRIALAILRVILGIIFLIHGWQKVQMGHAGVTGFFSSLNIPFPGAVAWVGVFIELVGGFALIIGLLTRIAALGMVADMIGAIGAMHIRHGFSMADNGYEYPLLLLTSALVFVIAGAGAPSIDDAIARRRSGR